MNTPPNSPQESLLGKQATYVSNYDGSLLFPIPRAPKRLEIGLAGPLPFVGADLWTAYELSWLNSRGKPQVALAHITVPCESEHIVESKSLKLYLGSLANTRFGDAQEVQALIKKDLHAILQTTVGVQLVLPDDFARQSFQELQGLSLDRLEIDCTHYTPAPQLLKTQAGQGQISEVLVSNLLKSNCLITGQPDWASVQIGYSGEPIDQEGLLQYLVSFRNHNEFHEQCVERMFMDIWSRCKPHKLWVYARYTRRGGIDINPFRTSSPTALPPNLRGARQ